MGASNPAHSSCIFCLIIVGLVWCLVLPYHLCEAHFPPSHLFLFWFSLSSPDLRKDIPVAPLLTHQNQIKFILQNIFCSQEVISNWLSMQAHAATVEYQEDRSIIGRPACSWPDPTSSFTLESRFRPDKRFRAAAPCGDPSQDTIYYPPLPPPPPSLASAQISSDHLGMLANNHKQTQMGLLEVLLPSNITFSWGTKYDKEISGL